MILFDICLQPQSQYVKSREARHHKHDKLRTEITVEHGFKRINTINKTDKSKTYNVKRKV